MAKIFFKQNYLVYAICKYESLKLQNYCKKVFRINYNWHELKKILNLIDSENKMEILIGSGFAELLNANDLISVRKNRGNSFNVLNKINSHEFFIDLEHKGINIPEWSIKKPINDKCLIKKFKSFGGTFIKNKPKSYSLKSDEYFQKQISGEHLSIQFFAQNRDIYLLCICNQFHQRNNYKPFLIKGLITKNADINLKKKLLKICEQVTGIYNLNGINNLDLILDVYKNDIYLLELNGRPGLSTNLIFKIHKNIYKDLSFRYNVDKTKKFFGTQIIYSKKSIHIIGKKFDFIQSLRNSNIFSELPLENTKIERNEPICLIHSKSNDINKLKKKLKNLSYIILNNLD